MKWWVVALFALLFIVIIAVIEISDNEDVLVVDTNEIVSDEDESYLIAIGDWPPYVQRDQQGLADKIVFEVCEAVGLNIRVEYFPWERCLTMTESGEATATFPWQWSESRSEVYSFSETFLNTTIAMFYLDPELEGLDPVDIMADSQYQIGVMSSYLYLEFIDPLNPDYSTDETNAIEKLINGRIDVLILTKYNGLALVKEHHSEYLSQLKFYDNIVPENRASLLVGKNFTKSQEFLKKFNVGLKSLMDSGRYDEIIEEFTGELMNEKK